MANLKAGKKRNDGSSSHQSIWLDEKDDDVVMKNERATMPKNNRQVMRNKWEKARTPVMLRLQKCPHIRAFFGEGEKERLEVRAHV